MSSGYTFYYSAKCAYNSMVIFTLEMGRAAKEAKGIKNDIFLVIEQINHDKFEHFSEWYLGISKGSGTVKIL